MKKFILAALCASALLFMLPGEVQAATAATVIPTNPSENIIPPSPVSPAVIDSSDTSEINKNILFDGSRSLANPNTPSSSFLWDFGDKSVGSGKEIIHTYNKPGHYIVTLKVSDGGIDATTTKTVFVYQYAQAILTNRAYYTDELVGAVDRLSQKNILVRIFPLENKLGADESTFINRSTFVFALTEPGELVTPDVGQILKDKTVILIADGNLQAIERVSRNSFSSIGAHQIILTGAAAVMPQDSQDQSLLEASNSAELSGILTNRKLAFAEVNTQENIGIGNFMLAIINYLRQRGMPDTSLFLLLCIPLIVTIISFFRQFIGIATLGIYSPTVFTIVFLAIGGIVGSATFIIIGLASIFIRRILRSIRIMYVPKMALVLIGTTIVMILLFVIATIFNYQGFITIDILPLILLLTMGERVISLELERGLRSASVLFIETLVVSLAAYFLLDSQRTNILAYPEIALLMIPLNYFIGKWTGLRISEVLRFRDLIDTVEQDTEE